MKRLNVVLVAALVASMSGCTVQKTLLPTGGSRSDGVVRLSYIVGAFEKPVVDWSQAQQSAMQRCAAWGFSDAEAFGGQTMQCLAYNQYGCVQAQYTVEYQCTGQPEATRSVVMPVPVPVPAPKLDAQGVSNPCVLSTGEPVGYPCKATAL